MTLNLPLRCRRCAGNRAAIAEAVAVARAEAERAASAAEKMRKEAEIAATKKAASRRGFIVKQGHKVRSWKRRFLVVDPEKRTVSYAVAESSAPIHSFGFAAIRRVALFDSHALYALGLNASGRSNAFYVQADGSASRQAAGGGEEEGPGAGPWTLLMTPDDPDTATEAAAWIAALTAAQQLHKLSPK